MRVGDVAEHAAQIADQRTKRGGAADDAAEDVVVPAEVLRRAVDDEVDAERRGAQVDRRRERRVDHRLQAALALADLDELREIDATKVRVRRHLADDEARFFLERGRVEILHEARGDAEARECDLDELPRHAVAVAREDDVIAALREREDRGRDGGHAAREEDRVLRAFERGHADFDGARRGVAVAPVLFALAWVRARRERDDLGGVLERVRRRHRDRLGHRVELAALRLARVHGVGRRDAFFHAPEVIIFASAETLPLRAISTMRTLPRRLRSASAFVPVEASRVSGSTSAITNGGKHAAAV